ncbi:MAG: DUF6049 family protein [Euzebya sp.]
MMRRTLPILVLALSVQLLVLAGPASAQTQAQEPPIGIRLAGIEGIIQATAEDAEFATTLELRAGPVPRRDLRLVTTVFTRARSASELREALAGELPSVFSATSTPFEDLSAGTTRLVTTRTSADILALVGRDRAGVYPVQLQVFSGPEPVGQIMTSLILLPEDGPSPLRATTVLRLHSNAVPMRGDTPEPALEALLDPGGPMMQLVADIDQVVGDGSAAGIDLVVSSRLAEDLTRMSDGFVRPDFQAVPATSRVARRAGQAVATMSRLAGRGDTEMLAFPYGPADLVALVRGGQAGEALRLLQDGPPTAEAVTGATATAGILVPPDGLDAATLAALGPASADAVLLDGQYLAYADDDSLEPVRRLRTADGGEVRVLVPDEDLSVVLADPQNLGTTAVVQQLLAQTALQWQTAHEGGTARSTGVLLALDPLTSPLEPRLLNAVTQAIATAPWLRPVNLSELRMRLAPSTRLVRLAYPPQSAASELPPGYVQHLGRALDALVPLQALLPDDDTTANRFRSSLQPVASVDYRPPGVLALGEARSSTVTDRLAQLRGVVQIQPSAPVTLTSATGEVPVTVTNTSQVALNLQVTVAATRFAFPAGSTQTFTLPPQTSRQLLFQAQSLNPGGFAPITVTIDDPSRTTVLTTTRISVRSTAVPVVGLVATVGSVLVLLIWGIRQTRGRRRVGRHERSDSMAEVA